MAIKLAGYTEGWRIASIATQVKTVQRILSVNHNALWHREEAWYLYPDRLRFPMEAQVRNDEALNDFDVVEILETGFCRPIYKATSRDNSLVVTTQCNCNCIMCPSPEASRKDGFAYSIKQICEIVNYIPEDAPHLTITGGEPTLLREGFFTLMDRLNKHLPNTDLLYLTNARAFSNKRYAKCFNVLASNLTRIAIPFHASNAYLHDHITQVQGSFEQILTACHYLAESKAQLEIRLVLSQLNIDDINNLVEFLIRKIPRITCVNYIALEMSGSAFMNRNVVWLDYRRAFQEIKGSLLKLVTAGIDVNLYNFPLCAIEKGYRSIARASISDYKVRYSPECDECGIKEICGGQFVSVLNGGFFQVRPIRIL